MSHVAAKRFAVLLVGALLIGGSEVYAQGSEAIFVDGAGNIGIGTSTPTVPLHIVRTSPTPSLKNLLRLTNNGGIQFLLERTDGNDWQFSNFGASFQISIPGGAQAQFQVISNGDVIAGNKMFATQFVTSSSRELKANVTPVDGADLLERLASVPIDQWTFKDDPVAHVGPMAEDFQAAFGFGQVDTGLSLTDTNGVALAAIQQLYILVRAQQETIEEQRRILDEQDDRMARLDEEEAKVAELKAALVALQNELDRTLPAPSR